MQPKGSLQPHYESLDPDSINSTDDPDDELAEKPLREPEKVAISQSRIRAVLRTLLYLLPVGLSFGILQLSFRHVYWRVPGSSGSDASRYTIAEILNVLQIVAIYLTSYCTIYVSNYVPQAVFHLDFSVLPIKLPLVAILCRTASGRRVSPSSVSGHFSGGLSVWSSSWSLQLCWGLPQVQPLQLQSCHVWIGGTTRTCSAFTSNPAIQWPKTLTTSTCTSRNSFFRAR